MRTAVSAYAEPGVLALFRWYCIVMFLLISLGFLSPPAIPDYFAWIIWAMTGLLTLYLSSNWLARRLKQRYLTLAVIIGGLLPTVTDTGVNALYYAQGITSTQYIGDGTRLYFWLLLPLIVVSTQYKLRVMFLFSIVTSLLPLVLTAFINPDLMNAQLTNAGVRLTLYTVVGYLVAVVTTAQKRQRLELAEKNAQLVHHAATLEQLTIARERNRLSRELHDTLAHTLSAVNVQLKALEVVWEQDKVQARDILHHTQELTRTGLQESRRALAALRASPIEELGLLLAIERVTQQASERAGFILTTKLPTSITVSPDVEQHLYRMIEEAMNNIVRHAHARHVTLTLDMSDSGLNLIITDDGVGFDLSQPHEGHYGLQGMRERAMLMNGKLHVDSSSGHGVSLRFHLPQELL